MRLGRNFLTLIVIPLLVVATHVAGDELPNSDAPIEYRWQLADEEVHRLFEQIGLLRQGDQLADVRNALGIPSEAGVVGDKKRTTSSKSSKFLTYAIKRVEPNGGNFFDQEVSLYFDEQDRLNKITYSGLRPLSGIVLSKYVVDGIEFYRTEPLKR